MRLLSKRKLSKGRKLVEIGICVLGHAKIARKETMASIITKRGDEGETDLLFGKRISKTSLRVEALGIVDELNTMLGLVRSYGGPTLAEEADWTQEKLVGLMGELAVLPEDRARYLESEMPKITIKEIEYLENAADMIEKNGVSFEGWARPGAAGSMSATYLDQSRTIARRAERMVWRVHEEGGEISSEVRLFLNRLSDYCWLLARREESAT